MKKWVEILSCDHCGKEIPNGSEYVAIGDMSYHKECAHDAVKVSVNGLVSICPFNPRNPKPAMFALDGAAPVRMALNLNRLTRDPQYINSPIDLERADLYDVAMAIYLENCPTGIRKSYDADHLGSAIVDFIDSNELTMLIHFNITIGGLYHDIQAWLSPMNTTGWVYFTSFEDKYTLDVISSPRDAVVDLIVRNAELTTLKREESAIRPAGNMIVTKAVFNGHIVDEDEIVAPINPGKANVEDKSESMFNL